MMEGRFVPAGPIIPSTIFLTPFVYYSPAPGVDGGDSLSQKIAEATRFTIISLYTHLNVMVPWADLMQSLTVCMKRSIPGKFYFLDA